MDALANSHCTPCEGGTEPLDAERVARLLSQVPGWTLAEGERAIERRLRFDDFDRLTSFLNALAWVAHGQGHHPDFTASAYHCTVRFTTHAIGGLSENDFICAARVNALGETP